MILEEEKTFNEKLKKIKELIQHLQSDDRETRSNAISALAMEASPSTAMHLTSLISSDPRTRNIVGEILLNYREDSVSALKKYISETKDPDDLKFAIDILGMIGNNSVEEQIFQIYQVSENENLILSCIEALGNIRSTKCVEFLMSKYGENYLFDPVITEALGKINLPTIKNFLLSIYPEANEIVKYSIIEAFGETGDEETFFFLLAELNNPSKALLGAKLMAVYNLKSKFGFDVPFDERMRNLIIETIGFADKVHKLAALKMLIDFDDQDSFLILLNHYGIDAEFDYFLNDKISQNFLLILNNLAAFTSPEPEKLPDILNIISNAVREFPEALKEISQVEQRYMINALTELLKSSREETRYYVQELLYAIDPECLIVCSDLMIKDNNMWNRARYLEMLGSFSISHTGHLIKSMTEDPEEMIKIRAEELLNMYGGSL